MTPSVSVIVPAFNAASHIARCVRSLRALDPAAMELIVVDDGSTDDTASLAEAAGARVIRLSRNVGPGLARNAGAHVASGEWLAFTDADCVAQKEWLAAHLSIAESDAWCASTGPYSGASEDGLIPRLMDLSLRFSQREMPEELDSSISSNLFVRRSDFLAVGGFPEYRIGHSERAYWGNEDQELAHLLVRRSGKKVRWTREAGPLHAYRATLKGHFSQQLRYAEAAVVSHARFPELIQSRANYSKRGGTARMLASGLALLSFGFPPFALPFLVLHAPAVRFIVSAERDRARRIALAAASYPFLFTTSVAWTLGAVSGAAKAVVSWNRWRREEQAV